MNATTKQLLIIGSELQQGDVVLDFEDVQYEVLENNNDSGLILLERFENQDGGFEEYQLFYEILEDVVFAKDVFGIDLK